MSRRPAFELSDNEEDFSEQDWETVGSGIGDEAEKMIDQLHLSLGSIKAGNSSIKLKIRYYICLIHLLNLAQSIKSKRKKLLLIIYSNDVLRSST